MHSTVGYRGGNREYDTLDATKIIIVHRCDSTSHCVLRRKEKRELASPGNLSVSIRCLSRLFPCAKARRIRTDMQEITELAAIENPAAVHFHSVRPPIARNCTEETRIYKAAAKQRSRSDLLAKLAPRTGTPFQSDQKRAETRVTRENTRRSIVKFPRSQSAMLVFFCIFITNN